LIRHLVVRSGASRVSVACVAIVFATLGGVGGMDAHVLSSHGAHFGHIITGSERVGPQDAQDPHAGHVGHHAAAAGADESGEQQQPSGECTCVGPCQGGTAPSITRGVEYTVATGEVRSTPQMAESARLVDRDPTSHLLPLPNGPPSRV
jgi:hypothetical protein